MGALVYVHRQYEYVPPSMWHGSVVTGASLSCINVPVPPVVTLQHAANRDVEYWEFEIVCVGDVGGRRKKSM